MVSVLRCLSTILAAELEITSGPRKIQDAHSDARTDKQDKNVGQRHKKGDNLSGKPGTVRELYRCQGNVKNFTKSHGNVGIVREKNCHGKLCDFYNSPL